MDLSDILTAVGPVAATAITGIIAAKRKRDRKLSRGWRIRCSNCGATRPANNMSLVKKAKRGLSHYLGDCIHCGKKRWLIVERSEESGKEPRASTARRA